MHFICAVNLSLAGEETAVLKRSRYKKAFLAPPYHYSLPNAFLPALRPIVIGVVRRTICRADSRSGRRPAYFDRTRPGCGAALPGCGGIFSNRKAESPLQRTIRRGWRGHLLRRQAEHRNQGHSGRKVLEEFAAAGAPEEILFQAKPHIGTDRLRTTVKNLRRTIIALGGEVRFETQMTRLQIHGGKITGVELFGKKG